jgi:hypothetical protein
MKDYKKNLMTGILNNYIIEVSHKLESEVVDEVVEFMVDESNNINSIINKLLAQSDNIHIRKLFVQLIVKYPDKINIISDIAKINPKMVSGSFWHIMGNISYHRNSAGDFIWVDEKQQALYGLEILKSIESSNKKLVHEILLQPGISEPAFMRLLMREEPQFMLDALKNINNYNINDASEIIRNAIVAVIRDKPTISSINDIIPPDLTIKVIQNWFEKSKHGYVSSGVRLVEDLLIRDPSRISKIFEILTDDEGVLLVRQLSSDSLTKLRSIPNMEDFVPIYALPSDIKEYLTISFMEKILVKMDSSIEGIKSLFNVGSDGGKYVAIGAFLVLGGGLLVAGLFSRTNKALLKSLYKDLNSFSKKLDFNIQQKLIDIQQQFINLNKQNKRVETKKELIIKNYRFYFENYFKTINNSLQLQKDLKLKNDYDKLYDRYKVLDQKFSK